MSQKAILIYDQSSSHLAQEISYLLNIKSYLLNFKITANGEVLLQHEIKDMIGKNYQKKITTAIFLINLANQPNTKLILASLALNYLRNFFNQLILIAPFIPYLRQDKSIMLDENCIINPNPCATLLKNLFFNADLIITLDAHNESFFNCFEKPILNINNNYFIKEIQSLAYEKPIVLITDLGNIKRYKEFYQKLGFPLLLDFQKYDNNIINNNHLSLDFLRFQKFLIIDDIIDSGTTIYNIIASFPKECTFTIYATHMLRNDKNKKLYDLPIDKLVITDSAIDLNNQEDQQYLQEISLKIEVKLVSVAQIIFEKIDGAGYLI